MKTTRAKIRCGGMLVILVLALVLSLATEVTKADFTFGKSTNLGPIVNGPYSDGSPSLSNDGVELFFDSTRPGGLGNYDLWVAMRATTDDNWGPPANLGSAINNPAFDGQPKISANGLSLFFASDRSGGFGNSDIYVSTRSTIDNSWGTPVNLGPIVNSTYDDWSPSITADGLSLFFSSQRSGGLGGWDVWVTMRASTADPWREPVNMGPTVNSSAHEAYAGISANGLSIFLSDYASPPFRADGFGGGDLWLTTRANSSDPWRTPVNLGPTVNTGAWDASSDISTNGSTLYFSSNCAGGSGALDLYQVLILPAVDLNGDGIVDSADICIMVDHWGENYSLCDIGPTPLGDGIVDVQDLIVLSEYLMQVVNDPTLVAHWALDEIEGEIASDSANDNDGTVYGDPAWQPESGMVDGALQLDGIDDYVNTPFVLNPADGKFSIFVWVKGGTPGQAVLSQMGGANWLCTDSLEGNLMTELKASGRGATEMLSQTIITDGNWRRIGLVWDGSHRTLYVDDIAVAEDAQANLGGSENGLYIGTGKAMEPGSFFSGLIDDVRIYNRAVRP